MNELKWIAGDECDGEVLYWLCPNCDFALYLEEGTPEQNEFHFCPKCGKDLRKYNSVEGGNEKQEN